MKKLLAVILLLMVPSWSYGARNSAQLREILSKVKNPPAYQCDEVVTSYVVGYTSPHLHEDVWKMWRNGRYEKMDSGAWVIIVRPDGTYSYSKEKDRYHKSGKQPGAPGTELDILAESQVILLGDETIDGKLCSILQGPSKTDEKTGFVLTSKYWIWKDNGLVLKAEQKGQSKRHTITIMDIEVKNLMLGDIPASVFAVPKEKIIDTPGAKR